MLVDVNQPSLSNLSNHVITNMGGMENKGIEFNITAIPVKTPDFSWTVNFNYSYHRNQYRTVRTAWSTPLRQATRSAISAAVRAIRYRSTLWVIPANSFYVYKRVYVSMKLPLKGYMPT